MAWRALEARFLTCAGVIFNVKRCGRNRWPGERKSPFSDLCWRIFNVKRCDKVFPCWSFSGRAPPCRQGSADYIIIVIVIIIIVIVIIITIIVLNRMLMFFLFLWEDGAKRKAKQEMKQSAMRCGWSGWKNMDEITMKGFSKASLPWQLAKDDSFMDLAQKLPQKLQVLGLDVSQSPQLTDGSLVALAVSLKSRGLRGSGMVELALDFRNNLSFGTASINQLSRGSGPKF